MAEPHLSADANLESFSTKQVQLGDLPISRALPTRGKRMIGPWCFLDRFGPLNFAGDKPMDVAPHPHIGIQTVTWLLEGEILHDDGLGCESIVRPGGVNVMTSGSGIAHAEQTPLENSRRLNGVQLWVALPETARHQAPKFESLSGVPHIEKKGGIVRVFSGSLEVASSPAIHYSELVGAEIEVHPGESLEMSLNAAHEYGVLVLGGDASLDRRPLSEGQLHYLRTSRSSAHFSSLTGGRVLLIGGVPFGEPILMWWNFVARAPQEIEQARTDWEAHRRFGEVPAYKGPRLEAPELVRFARASFVQPNPAS